MPHASLSASYTLRVHVVQHEHSAVRVAAMVVMVRVCMCVYMCVCSHQIY